jgi:hypothetical protein
MEEEEPNEQPSPEEDSEILLLPAEASKRLKTEPENNHN